MNEKQKFILQYQEEVQALSVKLDTLELQDKKNTPEYYQTLIELQTRLTQIRSNLSFLKRFEFDKLSRKVSDHVKREIDRYERTNTNLK